MPDSALTGSTLCLLPIVGLCVGAYGTIVGIGGGFLFVPLLLLFFHLPHPVAVGTSLVAVCANAISGGVAFLRQRRVDVRSATLFAMASFPGAIAGSYVPRQMTSGTLSLIFGTLLGGLALLLLWKPERRPARSGAAPTPEGSPSAQVWPGWAPRLRVLVDANGVRHAWSFREPIGMGVSLITGFVSSMLGIGGGIIQVPAMTHLLHFPPHLATATSTLVLALASLVGAGTHAAIGEVAWIYGLLLAGGAVVGAQWGAHWAARIQGKWLIRGLSLAALTLATRMLWNGWVATP